VNDPPGFVHRQFPLQPGLQFENLGAVRQLVTISLLLTFVCSARAQEQEHKLVDRILKPDTSMQNEAQNKKFTVDRSRTDKHATVRTFGLQQKARTKNYTNTRDVSTGQFHAQPFSKGNEAESDYLKRQSAQETNRDALTTSQQETRPAYDANKKKSGRDYSGNRPFLEQGKSQKSLNQKKSPMTIEQVRDLLNKNK
jgi:hypothetical protein